MLVQVRHSEIMKHVRIAAADHALLNTELQQLGFFSLAEY